MNLTLVDLKKTAGGDTPAISWFPGELTVLTLPENLTVSEWAAAYREFPQGTSFPGRWDPHKAPYAKTAMDAFTDPAVERITLMGAARSVKTEIWLNMLGYIICQDPGPALVVMPTETKVKRVCWRITKMIKASPELRRYLTGNPDDLQKKSIVLQHMEIIFATAGSAADLGEFEARYIFESETDKYPESAGGYGSPTQMAEMRARTFWNRKIITESTPTDADGFITKDYERSARRKFWVPCPECGGFQVLDFFRAGPAGGGVKHRAEVLGQWPKELQAPEYLKQHQPVVYECRYCQAEIEERQKAALLTAGVWGPENEEPDGSRPPVLAAASHEGYHWNALISPFATWSETAAKFFEVKDDREQYKTFVNEWLALPWKEVVQQWKPSAFLKLRTNRPAQVVPEETLALTAGIDSQRRGFWVVIRAWVRTASNQQESHKIRHGFVQSFGELEEWLFKSVYRTESGQEYWIWRGLIDTGGGLMGEGEATLTEQVYDWLRRHRGIIGGCKGSSTSLHGTAMVIPGTPIEFYPSGKRLPGGLSLWRMDTHRLKNHIFDHIDNGLFHVDADTDEVYAAHLAAEVKERNKKGKLVWTVQHQRDNHLLDCEVMATAAAQAFNVWRLQHPEPPKQRVEEIEINRFTDQPKGQFWK